MLQIPPLRRSSSACNRGASNFFVERLWNLRLFSDYFPDFSPTTFISSSLVALRCKLILRHSLIQPPYCAKARLMAFPKAGPNRSQIERVEILNCDQQDELLSTSRVSFQISTRKLYDRRYRDAAFGRVARARVGRSSSNSITKVRCAFASRLGQHLSTLRLPGASEGLRKGARSSDDPPSRSLTEIDPVFSVPAHRDKRRTLYFRLQRSVRSLASRTV